jgi:predicted dehydrogenase
MGLGGRGITLAKKFARRTDAEIVWFCDPDRRRWARAEAALDPSPPKPIQFAQDFRQILEDKTVDALVIDVEKPASHNAREGRFMIEAARKYNRVVQVGTQSRSAAYVHAARELIAGGQLGDIRMVRVFNLMQHPAVPLGDPVPIPKGFDYDLWCGPAPKLPYVPNRRWLNFAEFSCGPIPGDAIHQLDLARFLIGDPDHPSSVGHLGGIDVLRDGRDTPDTQIATYDYGDFRLLFQATLWSPYMQKTPMGVRDTDHFPDWRFSSTKLEILGTQAFMVLGRHGGGFQIFDQNQQLVVSEHGRQADAEHQNNFMACIRSRQRPQADIAQGHASTLLCHLANAAWRAGNRTLRFDPVKESFPETPEANAFLRRTYRKPWLVPDTV